MRLRVTGLLVTLALGVLVAPLAADAQQAGKVYRIGVLDTTLMALNADSLDAFRQGLRELGYVERQNFMIEYRSADSHPLLLGEVRVAARSLRVRLQVLEARGPDEFERAFTAMTKERAGALLVLTDGMFLLHRTRITDLAAKSRLPTMYGLREFVDAGGLMSYAPSQRDSFRHAATYVDKILKGAKPADLPVEQPTRFELVINLKTAKALGLTIPPLVLFRADEVIQ